MRTQISVIPTGRSTSHAKRLLVRYGFVALWGATAFAFAALGCGRSPGSTIAWVVPLSANESVSAVTVPHAGNEARFIETVKNTKTVAMTDDVDAGPIPLAPVVEADLAAAPVPFTFDVQRLVGSWRDSFCGQRTLTLNADGTATMVLELDFARRLLYGKRLTFDMRWSVRESILTFEILTGTPLDAARSAMKIWGEKFEYRVVQLDDKQLEAWASDDSTLYKLRRESSDDSDAR